MFAFISKGKFESFLRACILACLLAGLLIPSQSAFAALFTTKLADLVQPGTIEMGATVSLSGDWAAVGAPGTSNGRGAAYVYYRNQGGPNQWGLVRIFTDATAEPNEHYGSSVAIYADPLDDSRVTLVVGARDENTLGKSAGAVYVYNRGEGGPGNWGLVQALTTSPALVKFDRFGTAVVIWNDTIVVGAPYEDTDPNAPTRAGSAFIFTRGADGKYAQSGKVTGEQNNDRFGTGVAISGDTLAVGAPYNSTGGTNRSGAVYLYQRGSSGAWARQNPLLYAAVSISGEMFGQQVAISASTANTLVVGAPGGSGVVGAAYIFDRVQGSVVWGAPRKLGGSAVNGFGSSVALDGDVVAIGAPSEAGAGAFFVYTRNQGGLNRWGAENSVALTGGANGDLFASALAVQNNIIIAGAPKRSGGGAAYTYSTSFSLELDLNGPAGGYDYDATFTEDGGPVAIVDSAALTITDLDGQNLYSATVTITNPQDGSAEVLSAQPNGAAVITQEWISYAAGVLTIQSPAPGGAAPISDFQAVLRSVRYENTLQNPTEGLRAVQFIAFDGVENSNTAVSMVSVIVANDRPVVTAPASASVNEDSNLLFAGNLSVSDQDASELMVTLTATNGAMTLSTTSGLAFVTGDGTADALMVFSGSQESINAALNNAFFRPTANYYGSAALNVLVDDRAGISQGGPLTASATTAITVAPVIDPSQVQFYIEAAAPLRVNTSYAVIFTVSSAAAFPGKPTGSVTITVGNTGVTCTGELDNGQGTCPITVPVTGSYSISASYSGDDDFAPSTVGLAFDVDYYKTYIPFVRR